MHFPSVRVVGITLLVMLPCAVTAGQTYSERIVTGFSLPIFGAMAPDDNNRMFVGRIWDGRIEVVDMVSRTTLPTPFLDVSDLITSPRVGEEQGLLGMAFDPDFANNGYFYIDYTDDNNAVNVVRYRVLGDPATSNIADPSSAHSIINLPKNFYWHNGGRLNFGPHDGYLYISIGDAGGSSPPDVGSAQDITDNLHGKILRIDPHGDDFPDEPLRNYKIPATNPFVGKEGDDEIWAYGLRNPWQASFDRVTGDLWINDVGQGTREEVNYQPADSPGGENYGWWRREGSIQAPHTYGGPALPGDTEPIYDYPHSGPDPLMIGSVIAGSGFYRGPVPELYGFYLFSDFGSKNIWKLDPDAVDPRASVTNIVNALFPDVGSLNRLATFAEGPDGNMYLMEYDFGTDGDVFRIATASKQSVWNGNNPAAGIAGDGQAWQLAANWTRDGVADTGFVAQDHVIFAAGSTTPVINLDGDRTVSAVTFQAPYELVNSSLRVLSGNIFVEDGVTAKIGSDLSAETANQSIRKLGTGTLYVNGASGQIAVKEGTLGGTGTVDHVTVRDGAKVAPGDPIGILTVDNSFNMYDGATLEFQLNGADNSNPIDPQYDQLVVHGAFHAVGTIEVKLFDDGSGVFQPADGDSFVILLADEGFTDGFSQVSLPAITSGLVWEVDPADGTAFILRTASTLRSDFNSNGSVGADDFVMWRDQFGQTGEDLAADGTGPDGMPDGIVNEWDYNLWFANFGKSVPGQAAASSAGVPQPTAALLFAIGAVSTFSCRRNNRESLRSGPRTARG